MKKNLSKIFQKQFVGTVKNKVNGSSWKWAGFELIEKVEKFCKKHPEIKVSYCDDSYHSNSLIIAIPVEDSENKNLMFVEMIVFPQCSGESPFSFFLSPRRFDMFFKNLTKIKEEATKNGKFLA
jgi:hypothetical protein